MTDAALPLDVEFDAAGQRHRYLVVDVFTDVALAGNQLGVFTDGRSFSTDDMQRVARELNLAETVFVLPAEQGGDVRIRIFTPAVELPFAGHPVLGTAFVVGSALGTDAIRLETGLGVVPIQLERAAGRIAFGRMDQPIPTWQLYESAAELLTALGVEHSGLPVEAYRNGPLHVYVALNDEETVAGLRTVRTLAVLRRRKEASCCSPVGVASRSGQLFRDGLPEFVPPPWIDPDRTPRRKPLPHLAPVA